jgi:hypothetical protein
MGIVIDYSGTLDDISRIDNLIADVRLFCQQAGWEFDEVAEPISGIALTTAADFMGGRGKTKKPRLKPEQWPEEETFRMGPLTLRFDPKNPTMVEETLRGIIAHPPGTDSLSLTFDGQGHLCYLRAVPQHWVKGPLRDQKHYICYPLFCKTTGETEQHIAICLLLRMLRKSYIRNLKVSDETEFFKTGNMTKLRETHAIMAGVIGVMNKNPGFLKAVLKAAGIDESAAESAVLLPNEIPRRLPASPRKTGEKAKKPTIH